MIIRGKQIDLPALPTVHGRFEDCARRRPDSTAVVCSGDSISYAQLDAEANKFAWWLLDRGHGRGRQVGICLDYSIDLIVAIIGTLKAGAAYVPLDPSYPAGRLELLVEQVPDLSVVIATDSTVGLIPSHLQVVNFEKIDLRQSPFPESSPQIEVTGDDLCYAVFTSGSTGRPKLTGVRHAGWFNLLNWMSTEFAMDRYSHNLVVSAFGFDLSQRSLLLPLFCGSTQYLMASRNVDIGLAYNLISQYNIRTINCASSTLYMLVDWEESRRGSALSGLDHVLFGGEPLKIERFLDWSRSSGSSCRLLHQYGVAECTDVASSFDLAGYRPEVHEVVPVGQPVYNTDIFLVNSDLELVGPGERGEICIAGVGIGAGYLGGSTPESERFVTADLGGMSRQIYRTGDSGYVDRDGELVVVGRLDSQLKISGVRIDPADIERALGKLLGVRESAVAVAPDRRGEPELVAFIVREGSGTTVDALRLELMRSLPRTMVPTRFIDRTRLPLSPHGKVDKKSLVSSLLDDQDA